MPSSPSPAGASTGRCLAYRALLLFTTVLTVLSIFSVWANRQLLDTGAWTSTSTKLLENDAIRGQTASFLTDQLYANVDVAGQLQTVLPNELKPLAVPAAAALRSAIDDAARAALERPKVQAAWSSVNRTAHESLVKLIEDKGRYTAIQGDAVVLNLRPLLVTTAARVGLPPGVEARLPTDAARLELVRSDQLPTAQAAVRALKASDWILRVLVLAGVGLALWLAPSGRPRALVACGAVLVIAGITALLLRSLAGGMVVDQLVPSEAVRPAATAAWDIGTGLLVTMAWSTIFVGVPAIVVGVLVGPSVRARRLRARAVPVIGPHRDAFLGAALLFVLLLILWEPVPAARKAAPIALLSATVIGGAIAFRRLALAERPDTETAPPVSPR